MEQVAEAVSAVAALHHTEDLTEDGGGRGLEGGVEVGQRRLDAAVQRLRVLRGGGGGSKTTVV